MKLLLETELLYSVELLFESILSKHCCCVAPQIAWIAVLHAQHRSKKKHKHCVQNGHQGDVDKLPKQPFFLGGADQLVGGDGRHFGQV